MTFNHERIEAIGDQLRAKITSKFTASTFLAGFGLTILSGQVFTLWQSTMLSTLFPWAVGIVAAAVVLFVEAVLQLDTLTLPKRFWNESSAAGYSGSSARDGYLIDDDLRELQKHMFFYWTRFTLVATCLTGIGALMMLVPFKPLPTEYARSASFVLAVIGPAVALTYRFFVIKGERNAKNEKWRLKPLIQQPD